MLFQTDSETVWMPPRGQLGIDMAPGEDRTVISRVCRRPDGTVEVLESVEVLVEPLFGPDSFLKRLWDVSLRLRGQNVIDQMMPAMRRARFLHAHKGRKPKRGWPGRSRSRH
jgi:hypothetical protein